MKFALAVLAEWSYAKVNEVKRKRTTRSDSYMKYREIKTGNKQTEPGGQCNSTEGRETALYAVDLGSILNNRYGSPSMLGVSSKHCRVSPQSPQKKSTLSDYRAEVIGKEGKGKTTNAGGTVVKGMLGNAF